MLVQFGSVGYMCMQDIHCCSISICLWSYIKYLYQLIEEQIHCYSQVFLVGSGSNTRDIRAGELDPVSKKDVCQRRSGQSWN